MSVGLDLGTTEFRSIRDSGGDLIARRCPTLYLATKDTPGHRRLLERTQARHAICGDDLIVFGDDATECAEMLDQPTIPLLRHGRLPSNDPVGRQIVALMIEAVLPVASHAHEVCCITVPGGYEIEEDQQSLDVRFLKQVVSLRGYQARLISASQATVLAELSEASFSGIGINLGATNCEVGLIHCGRELARCSINGPLEELTEQLLADSRAGNLESSKRDDWTRECQRVLTAILTEARDTLIVKGSLKLVHQPARLTCTGGITRAEGFAKIFEAAWSRSAWPIKTGSIKFAANPRFTVARGGLIKAILEEQPVVERHVA